MSTPEQRKVRTPESFTPLGEGLWYTLLMLQKEPMHGYKLHKEVERITRGRIMLSLGSLYDRLDEMANNNMIEPDARSNRTKPYRITEFGEQVLEAERRRLNLQLEDYNSVLGKRS